MTRTTRRAGRARAALLVAAIAATGCTSGYDAAEHMARAQDFVAAGENRAAMIELKNVLAKDPANAQARLLLAQAQLVLGDAAAAEKELRRAEELGVSADVVRVPRARALIELGEADRALDLLEPGAGGAPEQLAEAHAVRGDAHRMLEDYDAARAEYLAALAADAQSLRAQLGLAQLEAARGTAAAAEERFADAVARHPDSADARLARAHWYLEQQRFDEARADFEAALSHIPEGLSRARMEALAGLTEAQLGLRDATAAQETVERLAGIAGGHPLTQFLRARLAFEAKDYSAAGTYLDDVLSKAPDYVPAKMLQGAVNLASGNFAQAEMYLKSVVVGDADNLQARKMLAAARLGLQQPQGALDVLRPAQTGTDSSVLAMLGQASVRAGAYDDGLRFLERSLAADPENRSVQLELAAGYLAAGAVDRAIAALEAVPAQEGAELMRRELLLVLALARKQDWAGARTRARSLAERFSDQPMVYNLSGSVELAAGDLAAARAEFERAAELQPDGAAPVLNLARVDAADGKPDAAYTRLAAFVERSPDNLLALLALAELDERRGDLPEAVEHLRHAASAHADALQPRLALARLLVLSGDEDGALATAQEAVKLEPDSATAQTTLGGVQLALGRNEEALASFRRAAAAMPRSSEAQYDIGRALVALGRRVQAREALERALGEDPAHVAAASLMAKLALESGRPEEALAIAERLEQAHPGSAVPSMLRGDVHVARAQYVEAARDYSTALERAPDRSLVMRLYEARRAAGATDARDALTDWLASHPDDVSVRLVLAQAQQDAGKVDAAIAEYERVLAAAPANAVALNNLAWLYAARHDDRALAMAERAHAAAPEAGEVTDTLGWLLVQRGDIDRALPLLRDAAERSPDVPEIRYHLAVALVRDGATAEARTLLHGLLESSAEFESKSQARALLDGL
jgi:putative PEP-CTERM system TPR-repeat lipoprotein